MAKSLKNEYIASFAKSLIDEGAKAINEAYKTSEFQNWTYNLHDSYGCCLYYDGKEYLNSRRYVGRKALVGKTDPLGNLILGRQVLDDFFDSYKPKPKGFDLVIVAAIFYAYILEKGIGLRKKYRVISGARNLVEDIARKYKGSVIQIQGVDG